MELDSYSSSIQVAQSMQKRGKNNSRFINRVGEKYTTNEGYEIEIIECFNARNCTIIFSDGTIVKEIGYCTIKNREVRKPFIRIGEKHMTNEGYEVEIIEYVDTRNTSVKFVGTTTVLANLLYHNIRKGAVKNPYHPSVLNIGYLGQGKYEPSNERGELFPMYIKWVNLLQRLYSAECLKKCPTYKDCSVIPEWHNFQVFAEWFENSHIEGFELDKDILIKGNKIYSPETCCFVPHEINCLLTKRQNGRGDLPIGVYAHKNRFIASIGKNGKTFNLGLFDTPEEAFQAYKIAKESYIKEVADRWRDKIIEQVYQALINYQVEITD